DDGQDQDQQHDQPVEGLADVAPVLAGVAQVHGSGSGSGTGVCPASASAPAPASASASASASSTVSSGAMASGSCASSAAPGSPAAARERVASASMRSCTVSPIIERQAVMPKSERASVAVAEKPTVRRNGGIGWRRA